MAIQFTIIDTRNPDEKFTRAFVQNKVTIGRARHCDICLPDLSVSTGHAEIRFQDNDYCLVDNGSLNGTWFETKKLVAHRPRVLRNGDRFTVSSFEITFTLNAPYGTSPERNLSQKQALQMLGAVLATNPSENLPVPDLKFIQDAPEEETASFCTNIEAGHSEDSFTPETEAEPPIHCGEKAGAEKSSAMTANQTSGSYDETIGSPNATPSNNSPEETGCTDSNGFALPTGPEDPLAPQHDPIQNRPQDIPTPPGRKKSDLGLILAGAVIVITCVVALIRLLA